MRVRRSVKRMRYKGRWVCVCLALMICAGLLVAGCGNSGQQAQGEMLEEPLPTEIFDPEDPEVEDPAADVEVPTPTGTPGGSSPNKGTPTATKKPSQPPYLIRVNLQTQVVAVFTTDAQGAYTVPVRSMICSTGKGNLTPPGTFKISSKYKFHAMNGGVFAQYATRFNGGIMFHSVPYSKREPDTLRWDMYNKLGQKASSGCIRMRCIDAKWIYDNCRAGTCLLYTSLKREDSDYYRRRARDRRGHKRSIGTGRGQFGHRLSKCAGRM